MKRTALVLFLAFLTYRSFLSKYAHGHRAVSAIANAENLFDARQSKYETVVLGSPTAPAFRPLWAPIDGFVANVALEIKMKLDGEPGMYPKTPYCRCNGLFGHTQGTSCPAVAAHLFFRTCSFRGVRQLAVWQRARVVDRFYEEKDCR